jgi:hypothetical protein
MAKSDAYGRMQVDGLWRYLWPAWDTGISL